MSAMSNLLHYVLSAVRAVAADHQILAEGHCTVAEAWAMFEQACEEAGPRDLSQLLGSLKGKFMLTPLPMSMDWSQATPQSPTAPTTSSINRSHR